MCFYCVVNMMSFPGEKQRSLFTAGSTAGDVNGRGMCEERLPGEVIPRKKFLLESCIIMGCIIAMWMNAGECLFEVRR